MKMLAFVAVLLASSPALADGVYAHFSLPRFGSDPPTLVVTVENRSAQAVPWVEFGESGCFAWYYLDLALTSSTGRKLASPACTIRSFPGVRTTLPAGGVKRTRIRLDALFGPLSPGSYGFEAGWKPGAPSGTLGDDAFLKVSSTSLDETELSIVPVLVEKTIARGETIGLPGGAKLSFEGHSHKDVGPGDGPGPLIVNGRFAEPGAAAQPFSKSIYPATSKLFTLGTGHAFELVDFAYGESMRLRYYGKLPAMPRERRRAPE